MWFSPRLNKVVEIGCLLNRVDNVKRVQFFSTLTHTTKQADRLLAQQKRIAASSWQYGFYSL